MERIKKMLKKTMFCILCAITLMGIAFITQAAVESSTLPKTAEKNKFSALSVNWRNYGVKC